MRIHKQQFLKYCINSAATLGLPKTVHNKLKQALSSKGILLPNIIWLNGFNCTGSTISLANLFHDPTPIDFTDLLFDTIDLTTQPSLTGIAGNETEKQLRGINQGNYILAFDGCIPMAFNGYTCILWTDQGQVVTAKDAIRILASRALAVLTIGTCGNIEETLLNTPNSAEMTSVNDLTGITTVNIPECPSHPDWIIWTIAYLLAGETLQVDKHKRPVELYGLPLPKDNLPKGKIYIQQKPTEDSLRFIDAVWDRKTNTLIATGKATVGTIVNVYNADTGAVLGCASTTDSTEWTLLYKSPSSIPCRLLAKCDDETAFIEVGNVPDLTN